jgi:tetratricopeptide (TPR) repeat protein
VEGSVQVVEHRLRVNVQLIDAGTNEHLWAESYDRTLDDAFAIQSDIAQLVVSAVGAALGAAERQDIARAPTANAEAYQLYLQGLYYYRRPRFAGARNLEIAQQLHERAVALDPEFALAHAALSSVHGIMHWFRHDPSPRRVELQREAAETAARLAPELPQARQAMGDWHFMGRRDYRAALAEYELALQGLPNDAWLVYFVGAAHRRLGNWDQVFAAIERAVELDPRNAHLLFDIVGNSYLITRRYPEAVDAFDRAYTLAPDLHEAALLKGWTIARWQGQLDSLRLVLERIPAEGELEAFAAWARVQLLLWERRPDRLLGFLASSRLPIIDTYLSFWPSSLVAGWAHQMRGDMPAARLAFDSARVVLDSVILVLPDDHRVQAARGFAFAGLGRRDDALREAHWIGRSSWYREDAFFGPLVGEDRAMILAQAGDAEAALDKIERLLAGPSYVTVYTLRLDPRWDPIREYPQFQALLRRYGSN